MYVYVYVVGGGGEAKIAQIILDLLAKLVHIFKYYLPFKL